MFAAPARACALLLALAATASAKDDKQPAREQPRGSGGYSAFPDILPHPYEMKTVKQPDGTTRTVKVQIRAVPLPNLPPLADADPPLRKVQYEQLDEASKYIFIVNQRIEIGGARESDVWDVATVSAEMYLLAAELAGPPAKRVPFYEERIRVFKELELNVRKLVDAGRSEPKTQYRARLLRLGAEADLLKLQAELVPGAGAPAKGTEPPTAPPKVMEPPIPPADRFGQRSGRPFAQWRLGRFGHAP